MQLAHNEKITDSISVGTTYGVWSIKVMRLTVDQEKTDHYRSYTLNARIV